MVTLDVGPRVYRFSLACFLRKAEAAKPYPKVSNGGGGFLLALFCVVDHALKVDNYHRLISYYPSVVSWRNVEDVTGFRSPFGAVIHSCGQLAGELVAVMRGLAAIGFGDWLDARRPLPSGLEGCATDRSSGDLHKLDLALVEVSNLFGGIQALHFERRRDHGKTSFS